MYNNSEDENARMDNISKEIQDTLDAYKQKAVAIDHPSGQDVSMLQSTLPSGQPIFPVLFPYLEFEQKPLAFEEKMGLTGIAGKYQMPEGVTPMELETYTKVLYHAQVRGDITPDQEVAGLNKVFDALVEINPQLQALKFDHQDRQQLFERAFGDDERFQYARYAALSRRQ